MTIRFRGAQLKGEELPGGSLAEQLAEIKRRTNSLVPAYSVEINESAVAEIAASGIEQRILPAGAAAPEFELADQNGNLVRSRDLLARGPLVINFFRGRWCPYCVTELGVWRDLLPGVKARGASLVAISPMLCKHNGIMAEQHGISFPLLSDSGNAVARQFGLVYRAPEYQRELYRKVFINLPLTNGDQSWELPLPATYVIAEDGSVLYGRAYADYTRRPEPAEALQAL